jgi:acetolactate synthase-1/2/3 large subunit
LNASYFATLGFALPTALGAKVAAPNRPLLSLADGAFGASNNDQRTRYGGRVVGTQFHNPDFVRVAEAFGVKGIKAEPDQVGRAVQEALNAERPTLIEVPIPTFAPPFQIPPRSE